ncbi:MAG TPA: alpha/beta fold hydrolase [Gemmatimonadaceae bacterium]|nr:alpha/beta fold hydrolase [Gemmatimonadaceae bacterium]
MNPRALTFFIPALILGSSQGIARSTTAREPTQLAQRTKTVDNDRKAGETVIDSAWLTTPGGEIIHFELGTLYVPENRSDPKTRIIGVGFARFRPPHPTGVPPTFHLDGGPGASFLTGLKPGNNELPMRGIDLYRAIGDVVFIDQRGYSERGDVLTFKYLTTEHPLDRPISIARDVAGYVAMSHAAVGAFSRKGVDLRGYDIKNLADDVDDLRKALGYDHIILVGQSFGSQWSFAVMRRHPEIVARALLFGVEPLDFGYDMPSHVLAAAQRMWREAEKDPRLKPYLPPGGVMAAARTVLQRLQTAPVRVKFRNEKTGKTITISLGKEDFQRSFAMERGGDQPAFILSLYYGHYDKWARSAFAYRQAHSAEEAVIGPLIDTSLGITSKRESQLKTDPATEFLGQWDSRSYLETAEIWPTNDVGDEFRNEIENRIPVVFVEGDWDTSTPIENTMSVAPYFLNGRVLIVEHGKHAAIKRMVEQAPETVAALMEFVRTGNTARLPTRIALPVPKFQVPEFPPPNKS